MKPFTANLINSITLIIISLWGYTTSATPSMTALIPASIGIILLGLTQGIRKENKVAAHLVVLLTFVTLIALFKPLTGAMAREDSPAIWRVLVMMLTSLLAIGMYIKNFRDVRKARQKSV